MLPQSQFPVHQLLRKKYYDFTRFHRVHGGIFSTAAMTLSQGEPQRGHTLHNTCLILVSME
jgi:cyclophilin family peptidyl-prolyl cis-trans isomerase